MTHEGEERRRQLAEEQKRLIKEAIKEWLDQQFATFGKWSLAALASLALAAAALAKAAEDEFNSPDNTAERDIKSAFEADKVRRLIFEIEFNQENRIRALEGKPAITRAQYRDALIALYKTL